MLFSVPSVKRCTEPHGAEPSKVVGPRVAGEGAYVSPAGVGLMLGAAVLGALEGNKVVGALVEGATVGMKVGL